MRLPDPYRECVVYLLTARAADGTEFENSLTIWGTGFIVLVPSRAVEDRGYCYLVTARHIVLDMEKAIGDRPDLKMYYSFNAEDEDGNVRSRRCEIDSGAWHYHPETPTLDIAVLPTSFSRERGDRVRTAPAHMIATDSRIADPDEGVGIGNEVYMIGLFNERPEMDRNDPITRSGIISCMPSHPVSFDDGVHQVDDQPMASDSAFLLEVRSFDGLSGSPVFLYQGDWHWQAEEDEYARVLSPRFMLLGLMCGYWNTYLSTAASKRWRKDDAPGNTGISVALRGQRIHDVLFGPALTAIREENDDRNLKERGNFRLSSGPAEWHLTDKDLDPGVTEDQMEGFLKRGIEVEDGEEK